MPSDKNDSGAVSAGGISNTGSGADAGSTFKVPISTSSALQQQQQPRQQQLQQQPSQQQAAQAQAAGKQTPPTTPPHEHHYRSSHSPVTAPPPQLHVPRQQQHERRLSVDNTQSLLVPKTPDHQNLSNGFENTPLQSPTKTPRSVKRRSADIYNLLKTPDHKVHRGNDRPIEEDEEISRQAKRSSLELYKLLNSEDNKIKLVQQSPTNTQSSVFHDSNSATSPVKNAYRVKKSDTEIKELSNNLKTRLNYAFLKIQNGSTEKPEADLATGGLKLEKSPLKPSMGSPPRETHRPRPLSLQSPNQLLGSSMGTASGHYPNRVRLDDFASSRTHRKSISSQTNANVALITALSPRQPSVPTHKHEVDPEKTAAISLMKLSSPVKTNATMSFSSQSSQSSPTKARRSLDSTAKKQRHQQQSHSDEEDNKTETDIDEEEDVSMANEKTDDEFSD